MFIPIARLLPLFCIPVLFFEKPGNTPPNKEYLVINPSSPRDYETAAMNGWGDIFNLDELRRWTSARHLVLIPDAPPVKDGRAFFVGKYGSYISFDRLDPRVRWHLFIDFVRFEGSPATMPDPVLTITIRNPEDSSIKPYTLRLTMAEIAHGGVYRLLIPVHLSSSGHIQLYFRETSIQKGMWGIWDLILSRKESLPESIELPAPEMKVDDKIF